MFKKFGPIVLFSTAKLCLLSLLLTVITKGPDSPKKQQRKKTNKKDQQKVIDAGTDESWGCAGIELWRFFFY